MRLSQRVAGLESRMPEAAERRVRVLQDVGQSEDETIAAYEAANGPVGDCNVILRAFTSKLFAKPEGSPVQR